MKKIILFLALIPGIICQTYANNVKVSNATLTGQNTSSTYTYVQFDVSWDNSWRVNTGPANWDAVWVFVKYQENGSIWKHASLSTSSSDHSIGTDASSPVAPGTIYATSDSRGVFMYRSGVGGPSGINWQNIQLKWNYGSDGVASAANVTVKVFAIEMVYIPQGPFFIGDGYIQTTPSTNSFKLNNVGDNRPFEVTSESAFTFQSSSGSSTSQPYDPLNTSGYTLHANYPKGFAEFYVMKYEITQKQYMDFFNTLNNNLIIKNERNLSLNGSYRNTLYWTGQVLDGMIINGGSGDRACNYMSHADLCAYADWSCMRPMSELEFEKACRGSVTPTQTAIYPINGEYAWGNVSINAVYGTNYLTSDNTASEGLTNGCGNWPYMVANFNGGIGGPLRAGFFPAKNCTSNIRYYSGTTHYGVADMSGNVSEIVVTNYSSNYGAVPFNRSVHGDGFLNSAGNANVQYWYNANQYNEVKTGNSSDYYSMKGGSWNDGQANLKVSDRTDISFSGGACLSRRVTVGGRCVRVPN
jgi:formylglycine-generating enzyme required for sulfatase activity